MNQLQQNIIDIHVCINCAKHQWCTRHDEQKYNKIFQECKTSIESLIPGITVTKNQSTKNPKIGSFEIYYKENLLFSKIAQQIFPQGDQIAIKVKEFLNDSQKGRDITKYLISQQQQQRTQTQKTNNRTSSLLNNSNNQFNSTQANQANKQRIFSGERIAPAKVDKVFKSTTRNLFSNTKRDQSQYKVQHISPKSNKKVKSVSNYIYTNPQLDSENNQANQAHYHQPEITTKSKQQQQEDEEQILHNQNNKQTLCDELGGPESIKQAVNLFYVKVEKDVRVKEFFLKIDMKHQRAQQVDFLVTATGGPNNYKGKDMKSAHQHLKLENLHFDAIVELLGATLTEMQVPKSTIQKVVDTLSPLRKEIVLEKKTLCDELGGPESIKQAVNLFYDKIEKDDRVKEFFQKIDMKHQRAQQVDFLVKATGGPDKYKGKDMKSAHQHLKLENLHFDAIVELLGASLTEMQVPNSTIQKVVDALSPLRKEIVQEKQTLCDELGGPESIKQAVNLFYDKVEKDDRVKEFFQKIDMKHQRAQQVDFLVKATGGPDKYKGKDMKSAHQHLKLENLHFDAIVELLGATLSEMQVPKSTIQKVVDALSPLRKEIVLEQKQ